MLSAFRRWLNADRPGSPSNPLPCGTPFLMEAQRATIARTAAARQAEAGGGAGADDPVGGSHPVGQDSYPPLGPIQPNGTHMR